MAPRITIRRALDADIPRIVQIGMEANRHTEPERYLWPYIDQHPKDFEHKYEWEAKRAHYSSSAVIMLAEVEDEDVTQIAGYGTYHWEDDRPWYERLLQGRLWERPQCAHLHEWSLGRYIKHVYWSVRDNIHMKVDRTGDTARSRALRKAEEHHVGDFDAKKYLQHWYLSELAVEPRHQGKHVGTRLLQWGVEQARSQGDVLLLHSAPGTDEFYEKFGLEKYQYSSVDGLRWYAMAWKPPGEALQGD